nr:scavenger receptor cysteine-rich type 1 protein M130-like [Peromyscus maniculatus bairdii]
MSLLLFSPAETPSKSKHGTGHPVLTALLICGAVLLILLIAFLMWALKRRQTQRLTENSNDSNNFNAAGLTSLSKYLPVPGTKKRAMQRHTEKENDNL